MSMRTPNVNERMRRSIEVKSNRDSEEFDRVKSEPRDVSGQSGQSGVDTTGPKKPPAFHSLPNSPLSDLPTQSASRFLSIELQTLSFFGVFGEIP